MRRFQDEHIHQCFFANVTPVLFAVGDSCGWQRALAAHRACRPIREPSQRVFRRQGGARGRVLHRVHPGALVLLQRYVRRRERSLCVRLAPRTRRAALPRCAKADDAHRHSAQLYRQLRDCPCQRIDIDRKRVRGRNAAFLLGVMACQQLAPKQAISLTAIRAKVDAAEAAELD